MNLPLAGRCILVTRPAQQATDLAQGIRDAGGEALVFPALEIVPFSDAALRDCIERLHEFDAAIFISPNAAQHGLAAVQARGDFPAGLAYFALGPGTARALARQGLHDALQPEGQDSEALLDMSALQNVAGKRFVIFRGAGGRETLAETLRARGAHVEYAECYRRERPPTDAAPLVARWSTGDIDAVTIASTQTLDNLAAMLGPAGVDFLRATPVFAPHAKIAAAARERGIRCAIATEGGDAGLLSGLITWYQTHA